MKPIEQTKDWARVFDQETFRQCAAIVIDKLDAYLGDTSVRGLKIMDPLELTDTARSLMTDNHEQVDEFDPSKLEKLVDLYIQTGIQVHSPGFMGRQFSGIMPLAGVIDMIGTIANQPASFYEAGQLPNVAERIMAREFNQFLGWPENSYEMVSTSGGALGNMTAILAARNERYADVWDQGYGHLRELPAIAAGVDCHYSITRAAGILGIGENQIVKLPIDARRRIRTDMVEPTLDAAKARGLDVFCIIASAGTTSVGAIDPLGALADAARARNLWLHVDGAHGASALLSDRFRPRLKGIEQADSFIMDAHKTLFMPTACTLLFYRNRERAYKAFRQQASYVFEKDAPACAASFDSAGKNFECTKRPAIMNLWAMWALYGKAAFSGKFEYLMDLAQEFYRFLQEQDDFETIHEPELNIVCFRYAPKAMSATIHSELQDYIKNRINRTGEFMVSKVDIDSVTALRVVFMNHLITRHHYSALIENIRNAGQTFVNGS